MYLGFTALHIGSCTIRLWAYCIVISLGVFPNVVLQTFL